MLYLVIDTVGENGLDDYEVLAGALGFFYNEVGAVFDFLGHHGDIGFMVLGIEADGEDIQFFIGHFGG